MRPAAAIATALLASLCCACSSPTLFRWGSYEESLYAMYFRSDGLDLQDMMARLEHQIEQALAEQALVPPGVRAHLGFLYQQAGNDTQAQRWLRAEAEAFPESRVFVEGLLARARR